MGEGRRGARKVGWRKRGEEESIEVRKDRRKEENKMKGWKKVLKEESKEALKVRGNNFHACLNCKRTLN